MTYTRNTPSNSVLCHLPSFWCWLTTWPAVMPTLAASSSKTACKPLMVPCTCIEYKRPKRVWYPGGGGGVTMPACQARMQTWNLHPDIIRGSMNVQQAQTLLITVIAIQHFTSEVTGYKSGCQAHTAIKHVTGETVGDGSGRAPRPAGKCSVCFRVLLIGWYRQEAESVRRPFVCLMLITINPWSNANRESESMINKSMMFIRIVKPNNIRNDTRYAARHFLQS